MSERANDTPSGPSGEDNTPSNTVQEGAPAEATNSSTNASPTPTSAQAPDNAPATEAGPSRRPHTFSYSLPIRMNNGMTGPNGEDGATGDSITWTFEVFPGPNQQGDPPQAQSTDAPGGEADTDHPGVQNNNAPPAPDTAPPPPPFTLPRVGPFGLAGARPPDADGPPNRPPAVSMFFGAGAGAGPGGPPGWPHILNHIMPIFASGLAERRPDPAKAAELIRALPTVDKGMMERINRVVSVGEEDSDGWKCSICFEDANDVPAEGGGAIKATPCHHLFHAGCLEPWLSTRTSCPMCRKDMDALRTQVDNEPRRPVRPTPNRSTPSTHPYARPAANNRPDRASPTPPENAAAATVPGEGSNISLGSVPPWMWQTVPPPDVDSAPSGPSDTRPNPGQESLPRAPGDPGHFGQRFGNGNGNGNGSGQMPFMTVFHVGPNGIEPPMPFGPSFFGLRQGPENNATPPSPGNMTDGPVHTSPMPMNRDRSLTPESSTARGDVARQNPTQEPSQDPGALEAEPVHTHDDPDPYADYHIPLPLRLHPFPSYLALTPPHPILPNSNGDRDNASQTEPNAQPHQSGDTQTDQPVTSPSPRGDKSLASYITLKERDLGLICASSQCIYFDANANEPNVDLDKEGLPELISVRSSSTSPPSHPLSPSDPIIPSDKKACGHKWHRDCLEHSQTFGNENAELNRGTDRGTDEEGRLLVGCGVCKVRGWILPREDTRSESEGEVERLVHCS